MAVKLDLGLPGVSALTSRPRKPDHEPDTKLFTSVKKYPDRSVHVSLPFPDSLELTCLLRNHHSLHPDLSGKPAKTTSAELDKQLSNYLVHETPVANVENITIGKRHKYGPNLSARFDIRFDPDDPLDRAFYTLSRRVVDGLGVWRAKLEFSARKAGPEGLARIEKAIGEVFSFRLHLMLPDMEVARIDAAVDFIGVEPLDLIGHILKEGKRQVWVGEHGRPETVYFYEKKKVFKSPPKKVRAKTRGPLRLTLYERTAYEKQRCVKPTYGDTPVTRAEVPNRWTKKRPKVADIPSLSNLLAGRRVTYAATVRENPRPWIAFCMAAFGAGLVAPRWYWLKSGGAKLLEDYKNSEGDILNEGMWNGWSDGLAYTGLHKWIEIASSGASP